MWKDDDVFMQIPHLTDASMKKLRKQKKGVTMEDFCKMTPDERKAL